MIDEHARMAIQLPVLPVVLEVIGWSRGTKGGTATKPPECSSRCLSYLFFFFVFFSYYFFYFPLGHREFFYFVLPDTSSTANACWVNTATGDFAGRGRLIASR